MLAYVCRSETLMTTPKTIRTDLVNRLPEIRFPGAVWIINSIALVAGTIYLARDLGAGWVALGFALMPDLGLMYGMSSEMAKGQIHPRAVPLYNVLHLLAGPAVMALLAVTGLIGELGYVAALAWAAHVTVDRALGYGLRTKEGFQRA
jgi:hypothetical protein